MKILEAILGAIKNNCDVEIRATPTSLAEVVATRFPTVAAFDSRTNHFDAALLYDNADERPTIKHALASLVRLASSYRLRPSSTIASSVAPVRRTEMDFGHKQRFGTTLGLSAVAMIDERRSCTKAQRSLCVAPIDIRLCD